MLWLGALGVFGVAVAIAAAAMLFQLRKLSDRMQRRLQEPVRRRLEEEPISREDRDWEIRREFEPQIAHARWWWRMLARASFLVFAILTAVAGGLEVLGEEGSAQNFTVMVERPGAEAPPGPAPVDDSAITRLEREIAALRAQMAGRAAGQIGGLWLAFVIVAVMLAATVFLVQRLLATNNKAKAFTLGALALVSGSVSAIGSLTLFNRILGVDEFAVSLLRDVHFHSPRPTLEDRPPALDCGRDSLRTIGPFPLGRYEGLATPRSEQTPSHRLLHQSAAEIVSRINADAGAREPRSVILFGSTSPEAFSQPGGNARLALRRAYGAKEALEQAFFRSGATVPVDVLHAEHNWVRWTIGDPENSTGRAVIVCVLWA